MRTIRRFRRHHKVLQPEPEDLSKKKGVPKVLILIGAIFAAAMMVIGLTINLPAGTVAGLFLAGLTVTVRYRSI